MTHAVRALAIVALVAAMPAWTHERVVAPVPYRGSVVSVGSTSLRLRTDEGVVEVPMMSGWTAAAARRGDAAAIRAGDFIASASVDTGASSGRAREVRVLEPGYRPEFNSHAMDQPGLTMTHAVVVSSQPAPEGQWLVVEFPGGARRILVPPGTPVTLYTAVDRKLVAPDVRVSLVTRVSADGVARSSRVVLATP